MTLRARTGNRKPLLLCSVPLSQQTPCCPLNKHGMESWTEAPRLPNAACSFKIFTPVDMTLSLPLINASTFSSRSLSSQVLLAQHKIPATCLTTHKSQATQKPLRSARCRAVLKQRTTSQARPCIRRPCHHMALGHQPAHKSKHHPRHGEVLKKFRFTRNRQQALVVHNTNNPTHRSVQLMFTID